MTKCNIYSCHNYAGNGLCKHNETDCTLKIKEEGSSFRGNQGQTLYNGEQPVLNRIADALEKIARELRRRNELEARRQRQNAGHEMYHEQIDEIMEE